MNDRRIVQCDLCQGTGWIDIGAQPHRTLGWLQRRCAGCDGKGVFEVKTKLVTLRELEEAHGGEHR